MPKISVLVLNWNGCQDTVDCINSLLNDKSGKAEVVVLDNGSSDGSVDRIRHQFPGVTLIENGANIGYTAGNNVGLRYAATKRQKYALIVNNDTVVEEHMINRLVNFLDSHPEIAVAGPVAYFASQPARVQTAGMRVQKFGLRVWQIDDVQSSEPYEVDAINGVALMVRIEAMQKVGLLDETFFMYNEELEWCLRFREAGYKLAIVPAAKIWHKIDPGSRDVSSFVLFHMNRGKILLLRRHGSLADKVGVWLIGLSKVAHYLIPPYNSAHPWALSSAIIRGLWHGSTDRMKAIPRLESEL